MPEQAEWIGDPNAHSDSGDYTWKPQYVRQDSMRVLLPPGYDTRTLAQKLDEALKRIAHLEMIVHRYINRNEGEL